MIGYFSTIETFGFNGSLDQWLATIENHRHSIKSKGCHSMVFTMVQVYEQAPTYSNHVVLQLHRSGSLVAHPPAGDGDTDDDVNFQSIETSRLLRHATLLLALLMCYLLRR